MADFDDTNRGVLFKKRDKASDRHPDYEGKINVNGTEYWLSAWIKDSKKTPGQKFMSLSVKPKEAPAAAPPQETERQAPPPSRTGRGDMDDEIPF